jgi:hypothetical protein
MNEHFSKEELMQRQIDLSKDINKVLNDLSIIFENVIEFHKKTPLVIEGFFKKPLFLEVIDETKSFEYLEELSQFKRNLHDGHEPNAEDIYDFRVDGISITFITMRPQLNTFYTTETLEPFYFDDIKTSSGHPLYAYADGNFSDPDDFEKLYQVIDNLFLTDSV